MVGKDIGKDGGKGGAEDGCKNGQGRVKKKSREYNEFGTKGGRVSDLNHYLKQL